MQKPILIGIAALVIAAAVLGYFLWSKPAVQEEVKVTPQPDYVPPQATVPDVNPVNKTNPFSNVKTNPF